MNKPLFAKVAVIASLAALGTFAASANASTAVGTFQVLMTVTSSCSVTGNNIQLGPVAGIAPGAVIGTSGNSTISVTCSNGTAYNVGLQSSNNSSTAGVGTLKGTGSNTDTATYQLYKTAATAGNEWGNSGVSPTAVGNGVAGTGTGSAQSISVYAKVSNATPTNPVADSYSDTVTATVYY